VTFWLHLFALALLSCLSPTAFVPAIILLGTRNGPRALVAYFAGGVVSVSFIVALTAAGLDDPGRSGSHTLSTGKAALELVAGLVVLGLAVHFWTSRGKPGKQKAADDQPPAWLRMINRVGWAGAFVFGLFWVNVVFAVDVGLEISNNGVAVGHAAFAIGVYAVIASCAPLVVLGIYLTNREQADARLAAFQRWMSQHGRAALGIFLAVAGLYLTTVGAYALLS
jgi:threonine/homoserine/homoserine lactone efflux protein